MTAQEQIQVMNQKLVKLADRYDCTKKARAAMDMRGQNSYHLYKELIEIETEIKSVQEKRDSLISK